MFSSQSSQVSSAANYIEDMFSTYLYTGNGGSQTITNGIDLAGKGGLVWIKSRGLSGNNTLIDSVRGISKFLYTNDTSAQVNDPGTITSFNSNGFTQNNSYGDLNSSGRTYASWTFREQPKFFDVVTYTGDGIGARSISHTLGAAPGCIIVKCTSTTSNWMVWHRSISGQDNLYLNATNGTSTVAADPISVSGWPSSTSTTTFNVAAGTDSCNTNGATYVAYLFAHNAGGFGLTGTDNVISCGSYVAGAVVNLGWEPQYILSKRIDSGSDWWVTDTMRGWPVSLTVQPPSLSPNTSGAESASGRLTEPTATGFNTNGSGTYIYIAIRRGPMKVPTLGTSVFNPTATTATTGTVITTNFPVDSQIIQYRTPAGGNILWQDRLRGVNTNTTENNNPILTSNDTSAESNTFSTTRYWDNTGYQISANLTGQNRIYWNFRRAPGFFDEVCYTGTGTTNNVTHNLTVTPELIIAKRRSTTAQDWCVAVTAPVLGAGYFRTLTLNTTESSSTNGNNKATATTFNANVIYNASSSATANVNTATYVAYLFATVLGVSKVGNYTGTGALQTVTCGFTSGARFVLIKRTDSTGDWYVWDSTRGISSGTDPYLLLNSTAAEVTANNYVDTDSTGFKVTAAAPAALNASGGNYIFLAIA